MRKEKILHYTVIEGTRNKDYNTKFNITGYSDGSRRIGGYLIDAKSSIRIDGIETAVTYARSEKELPVKKDHLIQTLLDKCPAESAPRQASIKKTSSGACFDAFQKLVDTLKSDPGVASSLFPSWNANTLKRHLSYFHNRILPFLSRLEGQGETLDEVQMEALRITLQEKTLKNGNSNNSIKSINRTVNVAILAGELIYRNMQALTPNLPDMHIHDGRRVISYQPEHAKSLPAPIRYELIRLLNGCILEDPNFAFHALLMLAAGLRDSEACAVTDSTILMYDRYGIVSVEKQINKDENALTDILKTNNAYRTVVFPYWAVQKLSQCIALCRERGEHIQPFFGVKEFSGKIKALLKRAGCEESFFRAAQKLMDLCPDIVGNEICTDVQSYILRRDYSSRGRNICGLTDDELDALLGHKRSRAARERVNYANIDSQIITAQKLERFVFDPAISLNPEFCEYALIADKDLELIPYNAYSFRNGGDHPLWIELDVQAVEPDEAITVNTPKRENTKVTRHSHTFLPAMREIIGDSYAKRHFNQEEDEQYGSKK